MARKIEDLEELLEPESSFDLERVVRSLSAHADRSERQEAALSALIWSQGNRAQRGATGALLDQRCLDRIDRLEGDLNRLGARDAALAARELRSSLPERAVRSRGEMLDLLETNPIVARRAGEIDPCVSGLADMARKYLKARREDLQNVRLRPGRGGVLSNVARRTWW